MTNETDSTAAVPAGWYPDPQMTATQRYWDGRAWTDAVAPLDPPATSPGAAAAANGALRPLLIAGILGGAILGLIMSAQSASLLTGTGSQWTGAGIAIVAGVVAIVVRKMLPRWLIVVSLVVSALSLTSVIYLEVELEERRQELSNWSP